MAGQFAAAFVLAAALPVVTAAQGPAPQVASPACRQTDQSTLTFYMPADKVVALETGEEWPRVFFYTTGACYAEYAKIAAGRDTKLRRAAFDFGAGAAPGDFPSFSRSKGPEVSCKATPYPDVVSCFIDRFDPGQAEKTRRSGGFTLKLR